MAFYVIQNVMMDMLVLDLFAGKNAKKVSKTMVLLVPYICTFTEKDAVASSTAAAINVKMDI